MLMRSSPLGLGDNSIDLFGGSTGYAIPAVDTSTIDAIIPYAAGAVGAYLLLGVVMGTRKVGRSIGGVVRKRRARTERIARAKAQLSKAKAGWFF